MEALHSGMVSAGLAAIWAALDAHAAQDPARLSDADLLAEALECERQARRLAATGHAQVAELDRRGLAARLGPTSTAALLVSMLRISPREAKDRVEAAAALAGRVGLTGEVLPPLLPTAAEAAREGLVSSEQVAIIVKTMDKLPGPLPVEQFSQAEQVLVDAARVLPPAQLQQVATRLLDTVKPDGDQPTEEEASRHRSMSMRSCPDGMVQGTFRLTPGQGAKAMAVLGGQAAPAPAADGTPDPRSAGQRMADALEDLCDLALRTGEVTAGGPRIALNITMTATQYTSLRGLAQTSYRQLLRADTALAWRGWPAPGHPIAAAAPPGARPGLAGSAVCLS